jgi:hypothetical protein
VTKILPDPSNLEGQPDPNVYDQAGRDLAKAVLAAADAYATARVAAVTEPTAILEAAEAWQQLLALVYGGPR